MSALYINIFCNYRLVYGKLYFHPPGQFLALNGRMGYKIRQGKREQPLWIIGLLLYTFKMLGNNVEAMLSYHEYRMLEKDNPKYNPEAKDQNKYLTTCNPGLYDSCMYNQLEKSMMAEVGCTVPYLPNVDDKICTTKVYLHKV